MKGSWRRGGQAGKGKGGGQQRELNTMRVRKLSLELLGWHRDQTRFALEGRLTFAHITDGNWRTKWKGTAGSGMKLLTAQALLVVSGPAGGPESRPDLNTNNIIFPKPDAIGQAVLLLVREKTSRFATLRVS